MLFNSYHFLFLFLPAILYVAVTLRGTVLLSFLAAASFLFYALVAQPWFLIPMAFTIGLDYGIARLLERSSDPVGRRGLLVLSLSINIGMLVFFKYGGFWKGHWHSTFKLPEILLPAGISFYTFQSMAYVIDVYFDRIPAERNLARFAAFISFFPSLLAGPISRHHQVVPALQRISEEGIHPRWRSGIFLLSIGLCKKVLVADRLGELVDSLLPSLHQAGFLLGWALLIGFALQLYFDFSGYADMAIGIARLFDIELPQNFNSPYQATTPTQFWMRWNITLSRWFYDYAFLPLSLASPESSTPWIVFSLLVTFFLSGMWHGEGLRFLVWGLYEGAVVLLYYGLRSSWERWSRALQQAATFLLVVLGFAFFRGRSVHEGGLWWHQLVLVHSFPTELTATFFRLLVMNGIGLVIVMGLPNASHYEHFETLRWPQQVALGGLTLFALMFLNYTTRFIYFQF